MAGIEEQNLVEKRLKEYIEYFVDEFDTKIEFYRKILEGKADPATGGMKSTAITGSKYAISGGVSVATGIPFLGPLIGAIYEQGGKKIVASMEEKSNKKEANSFYDLIYNYKEKENQEKYKRMLIEAGFEIFYSFEQQFINTTVTNGGETRAMLKLAKTTVTKIIEYFINNKEEFTIESVIKSVIWPEQGLIKKYISVFKLNRTVLKKNDINSKWSTLNILTKCGLQIEEDNKTFFFTADILEPKEYGYRRLCSYENKDNLIYYSKIEGQNESTYSYVLNLEEKNNHIDRIYNILFKRDPKKMEERFKEICENTQKEILNKLENIKMSIDALDLDGIKALLKNSEKDILNEICLYYIKNKNLFDKLTTDQQIKHKETINKLNEQSSSLQVIDGNLKETLDKVQYIHHHVKTQEKKPLFYQLPQFKNTFIGRQNELNELKDAHFNCKIVVINGIKGCGKSDLAMKYAFNIKQENNCNIIWINCVTNENMVYSLRDLALLLNFDLVDKTNLTIIEEVFSHYGTKQTLFVFDNCKENGILVKDLTNYVKITPNISVIITSTSTQWNEDYYIITLQKWTIPEAVQYIKSTLERELGTKISDDKEYEKLAEFHDLLPMKLFNATSYLIQQNNLYKDVFTIQNYIAKYSQAGFVLPTLPVPVPENSNENADDEDKLLRKIEKEAQRFGDRVSDETDRIGHQISAESARAEARLKKFFKNEVGGLFKW